MGGLNIAANILAARSIVMVAVSGGIFLTEQALSAPDVIRVAAITVYGLLVVVPAIWLAATGR